MFNNKSKLKGLRALVLKRCSSKGQVGTSIDNQAKTTDQALVENDLSYIDKVDLPAVTGSVPGNRTDIDEIIHRKRTRNDFDVLLIQDASRFTRAGQGHGQKLIYDLRAAGIIVYFVAEDVLVDSEMAEMYVSFLFAAARHAVKMLAYNSLNGSTKSYLDGRSPHAKRPPYGLDRMYSEGGKDIHIIRNLPDGTQEQLDPATGAVTRRFAKNEKTGVPQHYIKQKSETIRLVLGDPRHVAIVWLIFELYLVKGWTYREIARHLNDSGVPSPSGKEWWVDTVQNILKNPIYVGIGVRGKTRGAVYFEMDGEGSPVPSKVGVDELANSKRVRRRKNPLEKWVERPQPHLRDFLPEEFREVARAHIQKCKAADADGKKRKPNKDKHRQSSFWLKDYLWVKGGKHKMTGKIGGKNNEYRHYAVSRATNVPKTNDVLRRRIPAGPVEDAVLAMLRQMVLNRPALEDAIKQVLAKDAERRRRDQVQPQDLQKELMKKRKRLVALTEGISTEDDDVLSRKVTELRLEIQALEQRRKERAQKQVSPPVDVSGLARRLAGEFEGFGREIDKQDLPLLRKMLEILVHRMEVDLETMQVEVEFAVPSWIGAASAGGQQVGLETVSACKPVHEAHPENRVVLAVLQCDKNGWPACYTCRRLERAA